MNESQKIPKIIHYCWFGGNPLPELAVKCIESWKKYCPDYEIVQWNEQNYNVEEIPYTQQAYAAEKWAFVSDYARFKILYEHGGVYLDTDVELLRPLDDILAKGGFMASESNECHVATGLGVAGPKGLPLFQEILEDYAQSCFLKADGTNDTTTVVTRVTKILERHGLQRKDMMQQAAGIMIYPKEYFCPLDFRTKKLNCTANTHAIHYYDGSWWTEEQKFAGNLAVQLRKFLPDRLAKRLARGAGVLKYRGYSAFFQKLLKKRKQ